MPSHRKSRQHRRAEREAAYDACEDYRTHIDSDWPRFKPSPGYAIEGNRKQQERVRKARWVAS